MFAIFVNSPSVVSFHSGMFEDNTSVYMIEPLELVHDEVSLTVTSVSLCFPYFSSIFVFEQ